MAPRWFATVRLTPLFCKKTGILDRIIHRAHRIELRRRIDAKNPPKEPER
jgi:hypothetical protein